MCEALIERILKFLGIKDANIIRHLTKELFTNNLVKYLSLGLLIQPVVSLPTIWEKVPSSYLEFHFLFFSDLTIVTFLPASTRILTAFQMFASI